MVDPSRQPVAVVTGASQGIGFAAARALAAHGFRVFGGVRSEKDAERVRTDSDEAITPIRLDVRDVAGIDAARATLEESAGSRGVQLLVNNAGIATAGPLEALPLDAIREVFDVNVFGLLAVTQAFLPLLRRGRGRIINVGSVNGRVATAFNGPYSASKFAVEALSDSLRRELVPWRLPVTVVQPGAIATNIWRTSSRRHADVFPSMDSGRRAPYEGVLARLAEPGAPPPHALPAERVAGVIVRAATARRPRTRYVVGRDARLGVLAAWLLPDAWFDRLLTRRSRRRRAERSEN